MRIAMGHNLFLLLILISLNAQSQDYTIVKIDSIEFKLPGENWKLVNKNPGGGQFMFQNQNNKVAISLSARLKTGFEFYNTNLSDFELVYAFYKWDADYWISNTKSKVTEIKKNELKKYIIWKITTDRGENYVLSGIRDNYLIGLNLPKQKLEAKDQIELLENTFLN